MQRIAFLICFVTTGLMAQFVPSGTNTLEDLKLDAHELGSSKRVLFVLYAPSAEDFERIAAARLSEHASVTLAYITNGEALPDGEGVPYPNQVAARWREKAWRVASLSGSGHTFLNLPYIDAASSPDRVRLDWPADTVRTKWLQLMQDTKPDAVLISGFEHLPPNNPIVTAFFSDVASATRRAYRGRGWVPLQIAYATGYTSRKTAGNASGQSRTASEGALRDVYGRLAADPGIRFRYKEFEWRKESLGAAISAARLFPHRRIPSAMVAIDSMVRRLSTGLLRLRSMPTGKKRDDFLRPLVDVMAKIDLNIATAAFDDDEARRFLLDWKLSLEQIRSTLLGVRVWWSLSEHILTERQLTYLKIDSVQGLDPKGRTEVFFAETRKGWVINEGKANHHMYEPGQQFRIFSTADVPYDLPRAFNGLSRDKYQTPWYIFVVHQATTAEHNFSHRIDLGIVGAPRFSPEVLTPVVRGIDGEEVAYRLTNYSRDGVADTVSVRGAGVRSDKAAFRLSVKDMSQLDTLHLEWDDAPAGPYLLDLMIGHDPVANLLARRFPVETTPGKRVTLIGRQTSSALFQALRRLGYAVTVIEPADGASRLPGSSGPILIDETIGVYDGVTRSFWKAIHDAAEGGRRVVLFAQRAPTLTESGLFPGVSFTPSYSADTSHTIVLAGDGKLFRHPNDMSGSTWEGWLNRIASNDIRTPADGIDKQAVFEAGGAPVIFSAALGRGMLTYVDLNLSPQWANVLPAAYELLANIVESDSDTGDTQ